MDKAAVDKAAVEETVLLVEADGTATTLAWPPGDEDRRTVIAGVLARPTTMLRCGKGILAFLRPGVDSPLNTYAMAAFQDQHVSLPAPVHGRVLFARNPSKGSDIKPLTAAQTANLLVVTGARLI